MRGGGNEQGKTKSTVTSTSTVASASKGKWKINDEEALSFLEEMIPRSAPPADSDYTDVNQGRDQQETATKTRESDEARRRRGSVSLPLNGDSTPQSDDDHAEAISHSVTKTPHHVHPQHPPQHALSLSSLFSKLALISTILSTLRVSTFTYPSFEGNLLIQRGSLLYLWNRHSKDVEH